MANKKPKIKEEDLEGFKYFKVLKPFLEKLHSVGTERDRAGNRKLYFDQYGSLILLYFFNPIVSSLRGIQQASGLKKVQKALRCSRASLGSLSEATQVFDAEVLKEIIGELAAKGSRKNNLDTFLSRTTDRDDLVALPRGALGDDTYSRQLLVAHCYRDNLFKLFLRGT